MDFFEQQELARRNARRLVMLFLLALAAIIALANILITAFFWFGNHYNAYAGGSGLRGYVEAFDAGRFAWVGLAVAGSVGLVSLLRWWSLAGGGRSVAESLHARLVDPATSDPAERRALNIVTEMALAASMPVPPLYLLADERGINALAAGRTQADAIIAVTRGALLQLRRDELQGVIAHEFSHVLNGDMRLNLRLVALLGGITFLGDIGEILLHSNTRRRAFGSRRQSAGLPLVGLGLLLIGWLGGVIAGWIKAAISRQKEYLADASAVQFTRNPQGIADALRVIGGHIPGSLVHTARAAELSHLFFGQIRHQLWQLFATHPPLEQRILRLDPAWDGSFLKRPEQRVAGDAPGLREDSGAIGRAAIVAAAMASAADIPLTPGDAAPAVGHQGLDREALADAASDGIGSRAIVLGLLLAPEGSEARPRQYAALASEEALAARVKALAPVLESLCPGERFPLVAAAVPALKALPPERYRQFKDQLLALIRADRRTDLFEWCLFQLLRRYCDPAGGDSRAPRYGNLERVRFHLRVVLSLLAHEGSGEPAQAFTAATDALALTGLSLMPREQSTLEAFSRALEELALCYPLLKPRVLKAMVVAAQANGDVCHRERELIITVAACIDCPVPPGTLPRFPTGPVTAS